VKICHLERNELDGQKAAMSKAELSRADKSLPGCADLVTLPESVDFWQKRKEDSGMW
jgi:hypothetical protein